MQVDYRKVVQTSFIWIVLLADLDFTFVRNPDIYRIQAHPQMRGFKVAHVWVWPLQSESLLLKLCGVKPPFIAGKNLRKLVDQEILLEVK